MITDNPDLGREGIEPRAAAEMTAAELDDWFAREVLPLEAALIQFLHRNWRNSSDIADLKQDIYVRVYESALTEIQAHTRQFVFTTARNLLINRVRKPQQKRFSRCTRQESEQRGCWLKSGLQAVGQFIRVSKWLWTSAALEELFFAHSECR